MPYVHGHYRVPRRSSARADGYGCLLIGGGILAIISIIVSALEAAGRFVASTVADYPLLTVAVAVAVLYAAFVVIVWKHYAAMRERELQEQAAEHERELFAQAAQREREAAEQAAERQQLERDLLKRYWDAAVGLTQHPSPTVDDANKVIEARKLVAAIPNWYEDEFAKAYRRAVTELIADGKLDDDERARLDVIKQGLQLRLSVAQTCETEGYLEAHARMVADGRLTEAEDVLLDGLRKALNVPQEAVAAQLAREAELREAREVENSELEPLDIETKLKKGEVCYHRVPCVEKKKRVTGRRQVDGVRVSHTALEQHRSGTLFVTNQRLLLVVDGTTSIKLSAILDDAVDPQEGILAVTVDGRKAPYYFEVERPFVTMAYIDKASEMVAAKRIGRDAGPRQL